MKTAAITAGAATVALSALREFAANNGYAFDPAPMVITRRGEQVCFDVQLGERWAHCAVHTTAQFGAQPVADWVREVGRAK